MSKNKHCIVPDWPAPQNIHAATTLRTGGVSQGTYSSLNSANHVSDVVDRVRENRQIIKEMLDLPSDPVWLDQIHSNHVIRAVRAAPLQQADASYTDESGVVCAVMTADCLPLLVCSTDGVQVAAIHAGWRGLLAGVITNTVAAIQNLNNSPYSEGEVGQFPNTDFSFSNCKNQTQRDFLIWLGPAIGPDCFEVGAEVRSAFLEKSEEFNNSFKKGNNDRWLANIYEMARVELASVGITNVYGGTNCTVTEHERFYSYRRDAKTGRMATLIWRE